MGKIKPKTVKKTARQLTKEGIQFSKNFEENKQILKEAIKSKKLRNQTAGYLTRLTKSR